MLLQLALAASALLMQALPAALPLPGAELRAELGLDEPHAATQIVIFGIASHHTTSRWSVVATRDPAGIWTIRREGQETGGLLDIPASRHPGGLRRLSPDEGRRLDALIQGTDAFAKPSTDQAPPIGGFISSMAVVTPQGRRDVDWFGRLTGRAGEIANLVIGPA